MSPRVIRRMDSWLEEDNCSTRSEFIEKALRFYMGYLATEDTSEYLSQALVDTLQGIVADNSNRLRTMIFKWCVELNKQQGTSLLSCLLADLQAARTGKMLWSVDIVELNDQIADITRQDRLLAQLKQQGLVDPDLFISRRDALAEQLRAVKLEKERLLKSEENPTISQTRVLLETLEAAPEFLDTFDEELFREIVDKIIVESNERLRFRLINGLELTENIERTVR